MGNIREEMLSLGRKEGMCVENLHKIKEISDLTDMVDVYLTIPDWCLEHNYPTIEMLEHYFNNLEDKGVIISRTFKEETLNDLPIYIFHNCKGVIKVALNYDKEIIPMFYFANGCDIEIICVQEENKGNPIKVPLYIFGSNNITAKDNDFAHYIIHKNKMV